MRSILFGLAAAVLGLSLAGSAKAHDRDDYHRYQRRPTADYRNYHRDHGHRHDGGWSYRGRQHDHWEHRVWDRSHGRYHYYDSGLRCYFYWCPERGCYHSYNYRPY